MKKKIENYVVTNTGLLKEAVESIKRNKSRCVIVIDKSLKVLGVVSEGDILNEILQGRNLFSPIEQIMNINFKYLKKYDREGGLKIFKKYGITLIPIIDKDFILKDVLTINDLLS